MKCQQTLTKEINNMSSKTKSSTKKAESKKTSSNKKTASAKKTASVKKSVSAAMRLDAALTLTLAQASLEAYNDFLYRNYTPNLTGYTFIGRFTGWDSFFSISGSEEKFGLIFKSQTVANRFIVAFRGTASDLDALEDLYTGYSTFKPYRNSVSPTPNDVCAGFNGIYSTKGGSMNGTMQQQIFGLLASQQLAEVYITGHSLGGSLSHLFTLDMRVSLPNVNIQTINFASPKVGGTNWSKACANAGATQKIMRVINYWDIAPHYPLSFDIFDKYVSVGAEFQTAFYGNDYYLHLISCHRLLNLQLVLKNCLPLNPQIWVGTFNDQGDKTYVMQSTAPPNVSNDKLLAKLRELKEIEHSMREAESRSEPFIQS